MGRSEHDVEHVRVRRHDPRQGLDDHLDALAGRQQPEGEQDRASGRDDALLGHRLVQVGADGDPVRDDPHLVAVDAAARLEQVDRLLGQDDQHVGALGHPPGGCPQRGGRVGQHRVQRRDDGGAHVLQQLVQVRPGHPAEDPELVLDAQHVHVPGVQESRRVAVVLQRAGAHLEHDVRAVVVAAALVGQRHLHRRPVRRGAGQGVQQVVGEGRDAAAPRRRGAHQAHQGVRTVVHHVGSCMVGILPSQGASSVGGVSDVRPALPARRRGPACADRGR